MAARTRRIKVDPKTREKIRTTKLLQRLQQFALGEDDQHGKVEMSSSQVKAAQILIAKRLPDLTAADINVNQEPPETQEEVFERLVKAVGMEKALMLAPDFKRTIN